MIWLSLIAVANSNLLAQSKNKLGIDSTETKGLRYIKVDDTYVYGKKGLQDIALTKTNVDSLQLAQSATGALCDVISRFSPAFIKSYGLGSVATISFRGTAASHTQVEWNGININNPMLGQVDFSLIPVWFIDKVELYHGGSSMQLGSGSLGGTVAIGSVPKWGKKVHGSLVQGIGSFGNYQTFVSAGGGNNDVQLSVKYFHEQANNDFEYRNIAFPPFELMKQSNAFYNKNGLQVDLNAKNKKGDFFSLSGWYHYAKRQLPTIMSYEGFGRDEHQKDQDARAVARWMRYREKYKSELTLGVSFFDIDYTLANKTNITTVTNSDSYSKIISAHAKYNFEYRFTKRTLFKTGVNFSYHKVKSLEKLKDEGYEKSRPEAGIWAAVYQQFGERLSGYLLVREDLTDNKLSPVMPSLGVNYALLKDHNLNIKFNATRNYHQPTLNDLYWLPGGNPDLKPERGYSGDIGAEYELRKGRFTTKVDASIFASLIDDWILWQPSEYRYWTAENIKQVFARGLESTLYIGYKSVRSDFTMGIYANYSFTRTTNQQSSGDGDKSVGKQLIYVPLHKVNILGEARYSGFYASYNWSWVSERFTTSSNESIRHKLLPYALSDICFGKRFNIWKLELNAEFKINNLMGVDYQAILWRPMPKRNYNGVLRISF